MTYDLLDSVTLSSSASSVTFSSIDQSYRDLIFVAVSTTSAGGSRFGRVNGDSGTNYSYVVMIGYGSSTYSYSGSTDRLYQDFATSASTTNPATAVWQFMDYSATDKHKTLIMRDGGADKAVQAFAQRWANTSAITSLTFSVNTGNFNVGSQFSIYGVAS